MATEYKLSYTAADIDDRLRKANEAVLFSEAQELTDEQKAHVKRNIGIDGELALKADKTDIVQSDWNETDENSLSFIKNKPEIATDEEIIEMLAQEDMLPVVADADGSLLSDENNNVLLW